MANEIIISSNSALPKDRRTGLTLPLKTSLASSDLAKHKAMVAVELEKLAKKFDRFGWERDRGSMAQDGMIVDWIDALSDFPLDEIQAACRAAVLERPNHMPNEGHVHQQIMLARKAKASAFIKAQSARPAEPERPSQISEEERARRAALVAEMWGGAKKMKEGDA